MTVQKVKMLLNAVRIKRREYVAIKEKAAQFRATISAPKSGQSDSIPRETKSNATEEKYLTLLQYVELERGALSDYADALTKAECIISKVVTPKEHELLIRRYINCEKWEDIADSMCYSRQYIALIHDAALVTCAEIC